jgi:hypothetical protein
MDDLYSICILGYGAYLRDFIHSFITICIKEFTFLTEANNDQDIKKGGHVLT